jgi:surface antigen Omp85-like protein
MFRMLPASTVYGCVIALALVSAGPIRAQEPASRAEEQARQQQEKARALAPYRQNWIERQIFKIEQAGGFGAARGPFAAFGDIKTGSGFALGPAYGRTFDSGAIFVAKGAYSIRNFKMAQVAVSAPLASGRLRLSGRARWQDAPVLAVYALGTSPSTARADYAETKTEVSGEAALRPVRFLRFGAGVGFERFLTGSADSSSNPSVQALFGTIPGLDADPDYLHSKASMALDSRDGDGYSRRGSHLRAVLHDYRQQNTGPYSFRRVDGTAEQYVPILHGNNVLYFGLQASTTSVANGNVVPFFLMPYLGGGSDLRGYNNYRFRDRHSLLFTAEYRWYAQEFLDGVIFYDAGKAVPTRSDLDFSRLKSSVGAGIRFHGPQTTVLRLEVARGREGLRIIFAFSPIGG